MTHTSELTASDGGAGDELGLATAISKDTVVLGSFRHKVAISPQGAAYVFVKPASGWSSSTTQDAELTASDGAANDAFGAPVGVSGDTVMVGALMHQVGANQNQGAVYLFNKPGSVWRNTTETTELTATDGSAGDLLGDSAAISGNVVVAAAPEHTVGTNKLQGATSLFGPPPTVAIGMPTNGAALTQNQTLRASYSCTAPAGATITSCNGLVAVGRPIDTTTPSRHSFTVNAIDSDGLTATQTATYTVAPLPTKATHNVSITALHQSASVWRERGKLPQMNTGQA